MCLPAECLADITGKSLGDGGSVPVWERQESAGATQGVATTMRINIAIGLALSLAAAAGAGATEVADGGDGESPIVLEEMAGNSRQPSGPEVGSAAPPDHEVDHPEEALAQVSAAESPESSSRALHLLGAEVAPSTSTRLAWSPNQSFEGIFSATPVLVVNGAEPGPTVCLTAAVHGDELNGIETVRRVMYTLEPERLRGAVIGVPIVNLQGFHRGSRYLGDRRDLNRYFPGDPQGSSASRIAHSFFHEVIRHCSAVVDLHTGSFYRTNLPQLRGDLTDPRVVDLTRGFGSTVVLHSEPADGTLREAALAAGIPAVTLEAGAPMVLSDDNVSHSVKGIQSLLHHLDMVGKFSLWGEPEPVYYNSSWQRAPEGGIVFSAVALGEHVDVGDLLGTVTNPITNVRTEIRSSYEGRVLGMALNQVVQPGFATHHIGIKGAERLMDGSPDVAGTAAGERDTASE